MPLSFSAVPDKTIGDVFTEAMWDTYIRDNINLIGNPPTACATSNAVQSIPTSSYGTTAALAVEEWDTDAMYTPGNGSIVVNTPGIYIVQWALHWAAAGGRREAQLTFANPVGSFNNVVVAGGTVINMYANIQKRFVAGQSMYIIPFQDSGAALNLNYTRLAATWVAP